VTFIPKPGKATYTEPKAYCPISLLSFMLKTMEKLVDRQIRDEILGLHPLILIPICLLTREVH
jgi:hypothetical protein